MPGWPELRRVGMTIRKPTLDDLLVYQLYCAKRKDRSMSTSTMPQRLYLMQVATMPETDVPFVCYLVRTEDNSHILIDTGFPINMQPQAGRPMPVSGKNVIEQLAQLDLQPTDID